jgi:hypothetical protein
MHRGPTSLCEIITEDRCYDQETAKARLTADASRRVSAQGDFAGN